MLLRLLSCAVTPPTPNTSTITPLAYVMTQSGADRRESGAEGNQGNQGNQRGRHLATLPRLLPSAVIRQPPAVSLQPSAPSPSPERREATAKPSEPFSRLLTRPARGKRLQIPQPFAQCGGRSCAIVSPENHPAATLKVINTYVDNLLITC